MFTSRSGLDFSLFLPGVSYRLICTVVRRFEILLADCLIFVENFYLVIEKVLRVYKTLRIAIRNRIWTCIYLGLLFKRSESLLYWLYLMQFWTFQNFHQFFVQFLENQLWQFRLFKVLNSWRNFLLLIQLFPALLNITIQLNPALIKLRVKLMLPSNT